MERKVGSGRKGTVDEEEYLLRSITKLVGRFNTTQSWSFLLVTGPLNLTSFVKMTDSVSYPTSFSLPKSTEQKD